MPSMDSSNQISEPASEVEEHESPTTDAPIEGVLEEIEALTELDPAEAAERATAVADTLGRLLEEDER